MLPPARIKKVLFFIVDASSIAVSSQVIHSWVVSNPDRVAWRTRGCAQTQPPLYHGDGAWCITAKFGSPTSALGQKRTSRWTSTMSALPLKADIGRAH